MYKIHNLNKNRHFDNYEKLKTEVEVVFGKDYYKVKPEEVFITQHDKIGMLRNNAMIGNGY